MEGDGKIIWLEQWNGYYLMWYLSLMVELNQFLPSWDAKVTISLLTNQKSGISFFNGDNAKG